MADWDKLIALKTKQTQEKTPKVNEIQIEKNENFVFGDILESSKQKRIDEAMKKATSDPFRIEPEKPKQKSETSGDNWFNIPKANLTEEDKRDWEILRMRSVLKRGGAGAVELPEKPPEFLQFGVVQDNPIEGRRGRVAKRYRAPTIAESLAKDEGFREYLEMNYSKMNKKKPSK
ncbi:deoxynucleotidyltransferase terminal-interacting protein 2 [Histomonas meleagridis]|uniref:deoxynucleotidyltransferase terminal-interacting protein 2 n=1 Tax=Histomonas meleagridis TaxID=135588 RepID=UPI00355945DF|nr:deoxynucleotidyltransferase terminal-interacting protein 2 [Histomonas meleagridis]KAH0801512.1 deoxynucleotidyltransferase terminal-interacting protein 2 [Histomonas meleagridis]